MAALLIELRPPSLKYISSVYPPGKGKFVDLWPKLRDIDLYQEMLIVV